MPVRNPNPNGGGAARRVDNYRVFRPEAVEAYSTRRAGEPWNARLPFELRIAALLTVLLLAGIFAIGWGGR